VLLVALALGGGGIYLFREHQNALALQAERAKVAAERAAAAESYRRLSGILTRVNDSLDKVETLQSTYFDLIQEATGASHKRHDLFQYNPGDVADALTLTLLEKHAVETMQPMTGQKADAARAIASALAEAYGETSTAAVVADITAASEAESEGLSDWWHAASDLADQYSAYANGRYSGQTTDAGNLYTSSDDQAARSQQLWYSISNRLVSLKKRLVNDVTTADAERGSDEGSSQAPLAKPQT